MRNALALTAGPIMTHRSAGDEIVAAVRGKLAPSRAPQPLSYAARQFPEDPHSPPLLPDHPGVTLSDLRHAAQHEHAQTLVDLLFRRVPVGWSESMGYDACRRAAETVADILDWDRTRIEHEVETYQSYVRQQHRMQPPR